jgi:hypothetical protein
LRTKVPQIRTRAALAALALAVVLVSRPSPAADDGPSVLKDFVQPFAWTVNVYHGDWNVWSWVPRLELRVNGPIESGSQIYAQFAIPGAPPVKFDCPTSNVLKGRWVKTQCGGADLPVEKGSLYTGVVPFAIKMRNELTSTDVTLFSGKMLVSKTHSNDHGPKFVKEFVYYVDDDWNLPIGYVFLTAPNEAYGWKLTELNVAFWVRGQSPRFEPHLFYQGKEVGKKFYGNDEVGRAGCDMDVEKNASKFVDDQLTPQKASWSRMVCSFPNVLGWDKTAQGPGMFGPSFEMSANPGDYEFKLLWNGHLGRSIKFTVGPDGKFDNGIARANQLGDDRVIVPVQILGTEDGTWNHTAWQTGAFYGNPLKGFTASP